MDPDEITVYTSVRSRKFHESEACAPDVARRAECSLIEAVNAQRTPCGNCVSEEIVEVYREMHPLNDCPWDEVHDK